MKDNSVLNGRLRYSGGVQSADTVGFFQINVYTLQELDVVAVATPESKCRMQHGTAEPFSRQKGE